MAPGLYMVCEIDFLNKIKKTHACVHHIKEHVTQCNSVAHWCVFSSFWTMNKVYGIEDYAIILLIG